MSGEDATGEASEVPTVGERLAGWLSPERIALHLAAGTLQLDSVTVRDLSMPAPRGTRINIAG